jgi:LacI family repressor for deo operon, udp, cdd, tsx, nupC, and nupG
MANIHDVAEKAGVSITTVSRVLHNFSPINIETRKRVLEVIEELNYRPSIIAQGMRCQKTQTFGVLIPDFSINYYSELLNYIEMEARILGYLAIMCTTETDAAREKEYFDNLIRRQVDGFILCWYRGGVKKLQYLREILKRVPIVVMDQPIKGLEASSVYTDGYKGVRKLTTAFIKQERRDIAMIMDSEHYAANERRFQGYVDGLSSNDIEVNERLIVQSDLSIEAGYNAAGRLFKRGVPSAVVAIDDLTAIGALQYCNDQNIQVPDQVSITGFDDISLARFVSPRLTTIAQPMKEIAERATRLLISEINNRNCEHKEYVFEPEIVLRESTNLSKKDIHL